jgi:hypothetical protein
MASSRLVLAVLVGVSFSAVDVPLVARALGVVLVTFLYTLLQPPPPSETADGARAQGGAAPTVADAAAVRGGGAVTGLKPRPGSPTTFGRARSPLRPLPNPLDAVYYDDPDPRVVVSRPASRRSAGTVQQSRAAVQPPLPLSSTPAASETDAGLLPQQRPRIPDLSLAADVATRRALEAAKLGDATDAETAANAAEAAADALAAEAERIAAAVGAAVAAVTPPVPVAVAESAVVSPAAVRAAAISAGVESPDPYPTVPPLAAPQAQPAPKPVDNGYYAITAVTPPPTVKEALAAAKQAAVAPVVLPYLSQIPEVAAVVAAPPPPQAVKASSPVPPTPAPAQQPAQQRAADVAAPAPARVPAPPPRAVDIAAPAPARVRASPPSPSPVGGQPPGDGRMSPLARLFKSRRDSGKARAASPADGTGQVLVEGPQSAPAKPAGGFRFKSPFKGKREGSPVGDRPGENSCVEAKSPAAAVIEPKAPLRFWSPQKQRGEAQPQAPPPAPKPREAPVKAPTPPPPARAAAPVKPAPAPAPAPAPKPAPAPAARGKEDFTDEEEWTDEDEWSDEESESEEDHRRPPPAAVRRKLSGGTCTV